ncbi:hypothetical protein [Methylobacterium nodulans]|uniref:O-antigen polymerase n=1 Tax=Methylobacterium nodulans (strain LMG 21967 / CNCM I-2342 / ORS 2060) TaxID=460265 RepID=B8ISR3_METNO|nr:hypothetical protein [Methylobacterium nodulans]ACL60712.1 hypothetical protein Mnod_5884 [Methylobacterium nodulans ORS 2060]
MTSTAAALSLPIGPRLSARARSLAPAAFRPNARGAFWAAVILLGSLLGPAEAAVKLGIVLTSLRLALFIMLAWGLVVLARKLTRGGYVPVLSDLVVLALVLWMETALAATQGPAAIASAIGLRPVEFLSAYLAGRCLFGNRAGLEPFARVLLVVVGLLVLMGFVDLASGENIFGRVARQVFGIDRNALYITQYRFGLPRARASFEHAILFGTFFATCATLLYHLLRSPTVRAGAVVLCLVGTLTALSSAPLLAFMIFCAFAAYDRLLCGSPWRWTLLVGIALYGLGLLLLLVDDPLRVLIDCFTLDPQTGVYRFLIWEWVAYNLQSSPFFGIGGRDWVRLSTMVSSVDALWLAQSLHAGYVGLALLVASIFSAFFVWTPRATQPHDCPWHDRARKGVTIALVQMTFIAFTVHYWGTCWAFFALLIGIRAGLAEARYLPPPMRGDPPPPAPAHTRLRPAAGRLTPMEARRADA